MCLDVWDKQTLILTFSFREKEAFTLSLRERAG
jgi:hypothetical protein